MIRYLIITVLITATRGYTVHNYYWRDYEGYIPHDALKVDFGVYIGQHKHESDIIPGIVYSENGVFVGEYSGKLQATSDIKILCSPNHDNFKWVSSQNYAYGVQTVSTCNPVQGGYGSTSKNRWFIGRALHENMWKIGKVDAKTSNNLTTWKHNGSHEHLTVFEILEICKDNGYNYYWRDYEGDIPDDAVPAGQGLYIGQSLYNCYLIPGTIYSKSQTFVGEYFGKFETKTNIKILCSPNHDRFKWVNIENAENSPFDEVGCKPVLGGYQNRTSTRTYEYHLFIGKAFHEGAWKISKVELTSIKGLCVWKNPDNSVCLKNFELLKICMNSKRMTSTFEKNIIA